MARGRFVSKKISYDTKLQILESQTGPIGPLIFTWLIPHLDVAGRFHGAPEIIKGVVFPLLQSVTESEIEQTLGIADELELVNWYTVDETQVVEFLSFEKNQQGLRKDRESKSEFPDYSGVTPDTSGVDPEASGVNRVKYKLKVKDKVKFKSKEKKKNKGKCEGENRASRSDFSSSVQAIFSRYKSHVPSARMPKSDTKRYRAIVARLRDGYSVGDLCLAVDGLFRSKFHVDNQHTCITYAMRETNVDKFIREGGVPEELVGLTEEQRREEMRDKIIDEAARPGETYFDTWERLEQEYEEFQTNNGVPVEENLFCDGKGLPDAEGEARGDVSWLVPASEAPGR